VSGLQKLLIKLSCWRYNRWWSRRGEQEHFLNKLEHEQDTIRFRWSDVVADSARHRLKEG
jgi:hypothetical protein